MTCGFDISWVGRCKEPVVTVFGQSANRCAKHLLVKCSCGALATKECENTVIALVCGRPLCDRCACDRCGSWNRSPSL